MTIYRSNGVLWAGTGCYIGKLDDFVVRVKQTHGKNEHARRYMAAVKFAREALRGGENKGGTGGTPEQVSEKPKVPECVRELIQNHVNPDACCPCIKCCDTREAIKKVVEYYAK